SLIGSGRDGERSFGTERKARRVREALRRGSARHRPKRAPGPARARDADQLEPGTHSGSKRTPLAPTRLPQRGPGEDARTTRREGEDAAVARDDRFHPRYSAKSRALHHRILSFLDFERSESALPGDHRPS